MPCSVACGGGGVHAIVDAVLAAPPGLGDVRLLAIDGPSGAGKSTLADAVAVELRARTVRVSLVRTDDFATWEDPVSWWPRLVEGVLDRLRDGRPGRYRGMDWAGGEPRLGDWVTVEVPDVLIVEGVSAGRASVRPLLSHLCWLAGPDPASWLERVAARDGPVIGRAMRRWQTFERGWFAVDGTPQCATELKPLP